MRLFKIRREERIPALTVLVCSALLNALCICAYFKQFNGLRDSYKWLFVKTFHLSGYDPLTYNVISEWEMRYNVHRHPLLAYFMYIPSVLNKWLMNLTGMNLVQVVTAVILIAFTVYSFIFLLRIFTDVIGLKRKEALVMTAMNYSFAYVLTASIAPDHFILSMSVLTMVLYICGMKMKTNRPLGKIQTILLFILTAGVSLNNGVKVFLGGLFANGRRFFKPAYLVMAVALPALLLWSFTRWEYAQFVYPDWKANKEMKARIAKKQKDKAAQAFRDTTSLKDSAQIEAAVKTLLVKNNIETKKRSAKSAAAQHTGKPIKRGEFWDWTDISTSRTETAIHNLFGESLMLHKDYLLLDVLVKRPVIVKYKLWLNYAVEAVIVLLFLAGIWFGRRSRFMWLALSFFGFDMLLHMGIGFGINEIYIMSPHWSFVIPITIAYALRQVKSRAHTALLLTVASLTAYMLIYNVSLIAMYLML